MAKKTMLIFLLLCGVVVSIGFADSIIDGSPYVRYVKTDGNDADDGLSWNTAMATITQAVNDIPSGGIINVGIGDFNETVDVHTAAKQLTIIGTHKRKTRIIPTSGRGVNGYDGLTLKNISVEPQDGFSVAVHCNSDDDLRFVDCYISTDGADALYCRYSNRVFIDRCYIFSKYDTLFCGKETIVQNSTLITDGCYTGTGVARVVTASPIGVSNDIILRNCKLIAQPSYKKGTTFYASDRDLIIIGETLDQVVLENCTVISDGSKSTNPDPNSYASGDTYISKADYLVAENCMFYSITDSNDGNEVAYGVQIGTQAVLSNCTFNTSGTAASWDFHATSAKTVSLDNCAYDSNKVAPDVTVYDTYHAGD